MITRSLSEKFPEWEPRTIGKKLLYSFVGIFIILNTFIIILIWWPHKTTMPSVVTPVVATSVLGFGIIYWFGFTKLLPALGYEIDSNPDELVDGGRVVIYNVGFLYPHGRLGCDFANIVGK